MTENSKKILRIKISGDCIKDKRWKKQMINSFDILIITNGSIDANFCIEILTTAYHIL